MFKEQEKIVSRPWRIVNPQHLRSGEDILNAVFTENGCFNSAYLRHAVCLVYFWLPIVRAQGHNRLVESSEFNVQRANCKPTMEDFKSSASAFGMGYPEQRSFAWFRINSQFGANGTTVSLNS